MDKFLFVTDLDNTFVGNDEALTELQQTLSEHRQKYGTKIVYATGRSRVLYRELQIEKNLIEPDALVVSVGTEIYFDESDTPDSTWSERLSDGWNRDLELLDDQHYDQMVDFIPEILVELQQLTEGLERRRRR